MLMIKTQDLIIIKPLLESFLRLTLNLRIKNGPFIRYEIEGDLLEWLTNQKFIERNLMDG